MNATLGVAFALYAFMWAVWWLLKHLLSFSLEGEAKVLGRSNSPESYQVVESIGVLRSLEAIAHVICAALLPLSSVVLGNVVLGGTIPKPWRIWLGQFIGPGELIAVILASLFAYAALFLLCWRHEGSRFKTGIMEALFGKKSKS